MTDYTSKAEEVMQTLPDDIETTTEEIADDLEELVEDFSVAMEEAVRTVTSNAMGEYSGDEEMSSPDSQQDEDKDIGDLSVADDEDWFNIRGEVQRIFDLSEKQEQYITQRGIIADDTGETIYTVFDDAAEENPDLVLEEGESYELRGVTGDAYQGDIGVKLVKTTGVDGLDTEFSPPDSDTEIVGSIVNIQDGSGLIQRCAHDDCTRVLNNGRCPEHGEVDGEFDLRLKTVVDDGYTAEQVFFGTEATQALTNISLDEAIDIADDAHDMSAVIREMRPKILNYYYKIQGSQMGEYTLVNGFDRINRDTDDRVERARSKIEETKEVLA